MAEDEDDLSELFWDEDVDDLEESPELPEEEQVEARSALEANRNCPKCGGPGRIVSNVLGLRGHCGPCKYHWPIAPPGPAHNLPQIQPRGFSKSTIVEPNWQLAYEDLDELGDFRVRKGKKKR